MDQGFVGGDFQKCKYRPLFIMKFLGIMYPMYHVCSLDVIFVSAPGKAYKFLGTIVESFCCNNSFEGVKIFFQYTYFFVHSCVDGGVTDIF